MRRIAIVVVAAAAFAAAAIVMHEKGAAQSPPAFQPRAESPEEFPDGPGRDDTFYACSACHAFRLVAQQGMTRRQWNDSIDWMTERHSMPVLPGKERQIVLDYLETIYPPRAPAGGRGWQNPFLDR